MVAAFSVRGWRTVRVPACMIWGRGIEEIWVSLGWVHNLCWGQQGCIDGQQSLHGLIVSHGNNGEHQKYVLSRGVRCANDNTQGGRIDGNTGATMRQRRLSIGSNSYPWDDAREPFMDNPSTPKLVLPSHSTPLSPPPSPPPSPLHSTPLSPPSYPLHSDLPSTPPTAPTSPIHSLFPPLFLPH